VFLFAAVLLGRDPSSLSLYDASLSEWAAADDLPMAP
jgi:3-mercaptopyruvate sulfurtransferase SseA